MISRIVQLTDCHLFAEPGAELKGICVADTFSRVLADVNRNYPVADRLILTGDLVHDDQLETYRSLSERLTGWHTRLRVLPGNHDDRAAMRAVFGDRIEMLAERNVFLDEVQGWRLIGLDTQIPGSAAGRLGPEQLAWLDHQLQSEPSLPVCLWLHHPPVDVGSPWLDGIGLTDAGGLLRLIRSREQIRAVFCGHIHQELTENIGPAAFYAAPSTGVQFRPHTETLEVDLIAPGYRVLELDSAGTIRTWIERVG